MLYDVDLTSMMNSISLKHIIRHFLLFTILWISAHAWAERSFDGTPVRPNHEVLSVDLWPHAGILIDPTGNLSITDVINQRDKFTSIGAERYANFGMRRGAIWMHIPIEPALDAQKDWILAFGYTLLGRANVHLWRDGAEVHYADIGYSSATNVRPTRGLPVELRLTPGTRHDLFIQVRSEGSLIVPVSLVDPDFFNAENASAHAQQGIFFGVGLCLIVYALAHALILRRAMYFAYAAYAACMTLFMTSLQGLGSEMLWGHLPWMNKNASHLFVFLAIGTQLWFMHDALQMRSAVPKLAFAIRGVRAMALFFVILMAFDVMSFSGAHLAATSTGQVGALVTIPVLWILARGGRPVTWFVMIGWMTYTIGALALSMTFTGALQYRPQIWSLFQISVLVEMLSWFVVLGIDAREKYQASIRLRTERNTMQSLAETDVLTNLPNRRALMARLETALVRSTAKAPCAVFMMDLDGFKKINDVYGHQTGDDLLKEVGRRLTSVLRGRDLVARLGGDEFVVLAESLGVIEDAEKLAQKLINSFSTPFHTEKAELSVGLTIGYAISPVDDTDPKRLLQAADQALYSGKSGGKGVATRATAEQISNCKLTG